MAQQTINVGTAPNDGTGTPLRTAFQYTNSNFSELYTAVGPSGNNIVVPGTATITGDLTVKTNVLKVDSVLNRVGIGTASPSQPLDIIGGFKSSGFWILDGTPFGAGGSVRYISGANTSNSFYQNCPTGGSHLWAFNESLAMTLNATGLGVGGSPNAKVSCAGFSSANVAPDFQINRSSSGTAIQTGPNLTFSDGTSNNTVALQNSQGRFGIWNYGSGAWNERLSVDSSGNVGIGVTPTNVAGYRKLELGGSSISALLLNTNSSNAAARNWATASNFNAFGDYVFLQSNALGGDPVSAGTVRMTLDASGRLLVGPTSANTSGGILQLSSGITFPATQVASSDPNTLDDYEEGTFTPAITGSTTAGTATYVGRSGKYTKIGNLVQVQIFIDYNSHTGAGDTRITGLPFTNAGNFSSATIGYANGLALTAGNYVQAYVDASQSFILLNQAPTGGGSNTTVPIDPAATLVITATYTV